MARTGASGDSFALASCQYIRDILDMQNMSKTFLSDAQVRFIDELALLLTIWQLPGNAARLYGYLQISNEPVSLDEIARDLEISKSNACTAAKILESHGNARRLRERGTKRVLYVAGDDPGTPLRRQAETLGRMSEMIAGRQQDVAAGPARERLDRLAAFHRALQTAMEEVILPERQKQAG
jgi:predicted DNA-binding transcriptional regulator